MLKQKVRPGCRSQLIPLQAPAALGCVISCGFGGAEGIRTPDLRSAIVLVAKLLWISGKLARLLMPNFIVFSKLLVITGVRYCFPQVTPVCFRPASGENNLA